MNKINYLVKKFRTGGPNFRGITTSDGRGYDPDYTEYVNRMLDSVPPIRRAAILAAAIEESGMDPRAVGKGGERGIFQYSEDRYIPHPKGDDNVTDYELMRWQLQQGLSDMSRYPDESGNWTHGGENTGIMKAEDAYNAFYNSDATLEDTNNYLNLGFIRPKGKMQSANNRMKVAQQVYDILTSYKPAVSKPKQKSFWEGIVDWLD